MLKAIFYKKYFLSVRVAHNDGSGEYSWWNTILNVKRFTSADNILVAARDLSAEELQRRIPRVIFQMDIEVISLNRI